MKSLRASKRKETRQMIKNKATGMVDAIKGKAAEANEIADSVKEKTTRASTNLRAKIHLMTIG